MRSALVPKRAAASDPEWQRFLEDLQRELWADRPETQSQRREDRP
jgi:hypothetical protein